MVKATAVCVCALAVVCVAISGCDGGSAGPDDSDSSECESVQMTVVWAWHASGYWVERDEYIDEPVTYVSGFLIDDPIPTLESVTVNQESFLGSDIAYYDYTYVSFGELGPSQPAIYSDFDPLNVTVATSSGEVEGTQTLPDTIAALAVTEQSIEIGESLTISWQGSDADFYRAWVAYTYVEGDPPGLHTTHKDSVVSQQSLTIDGSFFAWDGEVSFIDVTPVSGPFPAAGAESNMSGSGRGFLYYANEAKEYPSTIPVGAGLPDSDADRQPVRRCGSDIRALRRISGRLVEREMQKTTGSKVR